MTNDQFKTLCHGIQSIGSGLDTLLRLSKDLGEKDKYEAILITNLATLIADANNLLATRSNEFIIEG